MIQNFICKYCNKEFSRPVRQSSRGTFEFCSPICRNKSRSLKDIPCPVCGKMFKPRINDMKADNKGTVRKRFCSQECGNKSRRGKPSTNPFTHSQKTRQFVLENYSIHGAQWVAKRLGISIKAIHCLAHKIGAGIRDNPKGLERQYDIVKHYMTNHNPMKNQETVNKVKLFRKNHPEVFKNIHLKVLLSIQRNKPSKPELKCKEILKTIGISFDHQVIIKNKFVVDFRIEKIIIQVDGEYWHGHPRFEPLTKQQIAQRKRDAAQDKYLTTCGYIIIRIWERDVIYDHILKILKSMGVECHPLSAASE